MKKLTFNYQAQGAQITPVKRAWLIVAVVAVVLIRFSATVCAQETKTHPLFMLGANDPRGEGKGIFPGRVVWTHAPGTATWDGTTGNWFEDRWNNQENCNWLVQKSLTELTGKTDEAAAWKALFNYFNKTHGKTGGYKAGEKIAIKINQNNTYSHANSEETNASPDMVLALLRSLINKGKVPQNRITVADPSRYITDDIYLKCSKEFPDVIYLDNSGGDGRTKATYVEKAIPYSANNGNVAQGLAACFVEADYVINLALLKGHVGQGVTLCSKNWYGTTSINADWHKNFHNNFDQERSGKPKYIIFVDFIGHKDLGQKTILYLIDGLYGSENVAGKPSGKWKLKPFNGDWPNSLFVSQDPIAIDAVGLDFLSSEFPGMVDIDYADAYMVEAATIPNSPSGTTYDPEQDGIALSHSLGVVEHWNNAANKQYSRNMGKKIGIELIKVEK